MLLIARLLPRASDAWEQLYIDLYCGYACSSIEEAKNVPAKKS